MKMNVNFFATLRRVTGGKTVEFDLPDEVTAGEVLDAVITRFPAMRDDLLDENGELHRHCHMFINGRGVPFLLEKMDTVVQPGDTVNIFPAVGGGAADDGCGADGSGG
jgi:molybdopterin synthase sulfur carrier subunit